MVTTQAQKRLGLMPYSWYIPASPAIPGPWKAPKSFCDPCITKMKPRKTCRITTAHRSSPSNRCSIGASSPAAGRSGPGGHSFRSATPTDMRPIRSISRVTSSPGLSGPTPSGVPVEKRSPG